VLAYAVPSVYQLVGFRLSAFGYQLSGISFQPEKNGGLALLMADR
jgi:hypothetical protein